jgi:LCP family protein required for cell wall assembly
MRQPTQRRVVAGLLSMLIPGAGQLYAGARHRGLVLIAISALVLAGLLALAAAGVFSGVDRRLVAGMLAIDLALLAFRLYAVLDAWRGGHALHLHLALVALAALTAVPHVAAGYVTVRSYSVLETVFADTEPADVLPTKGGLFLVRRFDEPPEPYPLVDPWEHVLARRLGPGEARPLDSSPQMLQGTAATSKPWTTILLLGTDEGPGNWGIRTDTIILVALQHGTGRAAAFGIPRNLTLVPLGGAAARATRRFPQSLNALFGFARTRPDLFPGARDPGATALKQTVSRLLGIRVDYHALVNLSGFADLVDALGGVRIHVKERLVDEVTRPAWGEPKPRIDVQPGYTYHFDGREALAYVRSRKDSNDYTRMARQRCFLSAMADQLNPLRVLRSFGALARTVEANVRTDVPLDQLPALTRLVAGIDQAETLTETFGLAYIARRRASDNLPVPNIPLMRATVREAILHPEQTRASGNIATAKETC